MILQCPECQARFIVPDPLIPPEGRTVKCGRCSHQWHADKPEGAAIPEFVAMAAEHAIQDNPVSSTPPQLPVIRKGPISATPFMWGVPLVIGLWVLVAFTAYYPNWLRQPVLSGIYRAAGVTPTDGLVFEDVAMQRLTKEAGQTNFLLAGSISNRSAEPRILPVVRVQLKNPEGAVIWSRDYEVNETVKAGDTYPFRIDNVETSFADNVASIALDLGHPLQLMMR